MKKLFLFCTMLMALLLAGTGQVRAGELTVHDGTATNEFIPFWGYWVDDGSTKSEMIYPATELYFMTDSDIKSLTFYKTSGETTSSWGNASFQVFLKEVDNTTMGSGYIGMENATIVYQGGVDASGGERTVTINFDEPYHYNGGNLLVGIYETRVGSYSKAIWYGEAVTGGSAYSRSGSSYTKKDFIPKTTFSYIEPAKWNDKISAYEIANVENLYWFAYFVNSGNTGANAVLTADIVVNENVLLEDGSLNEAEKDNFKVWVPIGTWDNAYHGTFDGQGHTISGLYFNNSETQCIGLFGRADMADATIKNVGIVDTYFYGYEKVGGICGYRGNIINCFNTGTIKGSNREIGGICGSDCAVDYSYNTGIVSGGNSVGGISGGWNKINYCYNTGSVSGSYDVGGICGYANDANTIITGCFNNGSVTGTSNKVGGVCGSIYSSNTVVSNYYLAGCAVDGNSTIQNGVGSSSVGSTSDDQTGTVSASSDLLASGEVAYNINQSAGTIVFYQSIGSDLIPTFDDSHGVVMMPESGEYETHYHSFSNGFCSCGLVFEEPDFNGNAYIIDNGGKLYWFAKYVNSGYQTANAVLTADIVVNTGVIDANGDFTGDLDNNNFMEWTPIGTDNCYYGGTFDGYGHTISGLYFYNTTDASYPVGGVYSGLIGACDGATIKNVGVIDSYLHGSFNVGGILGYSLGSSSITNCFNTSTIVAVNGCAGGICGFNRECSITNCFSTGKIVGSTNIGGIVGQLGVETTNNYVLEGSVSDATGGTFATAEQFANGEVTFLINEYAESYIYFQNIGTDPIPSFDESHGLVFGGNGNYYTHFHGYENNGFCSCGHKEKPYFNGTAYEIDNAGKLYWFSDLVFFGTDPSANAVLTANIVDHTNLLNSDGTLNSANVRREWKPIGDNGENYYGTFDGQGYSISGLYSSAFMYSGLFGFANNATIKNVEVYDSYFSARQHVGGICGYVAGYTTITNCYNEATVVATVNGESNAGGICGYIESSSVVLIDNCHNAGYVEAYCSNAGGICGYQYAGTIQNCYNAGRIYAKAANSTSNNSYAGGISGRINGLDTKLITNCYNTGSVEGLGKYAGGICGYIGNGTITCCFNAGTVTANANFGGIYSGSGGTSGNNYVLQNSVGNANGGSFKTFSQFASGEVTYLLNQNNSQPNWRQTLEQDVYPTLNANSAVVYLTEPCQSYSNSTDFKDHEFVDGHCTICGAAEEAKWNEELNAFEIANATQLLWFADYVNNEDNHANAILTADIVVNSNVLNADGSLNGDLDDNNFIEWTPIGTNNSRYHGIFDGQGHTVSGLYYYNTEDESYPDGGINIGLFGVVGDDATIVNVGVIDSYLHGSFEVGGIVGWAIGSDITIANCFNTSTIVVEQAMGGGIVGYAYSSSSYSSSIANCFNTGRIICNYEVDDVNVGMGGGPVLTNYGFIGGIVGENDSERMITNCYYLAGSAICGGKEQNGIGYPGGYSRPDSKGSTTPATAEQFSNGFVAGNINMSVDYTIYYQTIGSDALPTLNSSHAEVYASMPCPSEFGNNPNALSEKEHVFVNGVCVCGEHESAAWDEEANAFAIANVGQLYWFADMVNSGELYDSPDYAPNAYLTADIEVNANLMSAFYDPSALGTLIEWTPIGNDDYDYYGTFDGMGHTISGLYLQSNEDYKGLFGVTYDATIQNLGVIGSAIMGDAYVGAIVGRAEGATTVTNCFNTSSYINASEVVGGICGYIYDSGSITNCFSTGEVHGYNFTGSIVGKNYGTVSNCFYLEGSASNWNGTTYGGVGAGDEPVDDATTAATAIEFRVGAIAYALNGYSSNEEDVVWYQTIGSDANPTLNSEHGVVYTSEPCPYNNTGESHTEHVFVNGECVCGLINEPEYDSEHDTYLIANAGQLYWFADFVNSGEGVSANAILTADIVVNENVLSENGIPNRDDFKVWTPIGIASEGGYTGFFDGQGHTISGLFFDNSNGNNPYPAGGACVGLFGYAAEGAQIRNVGLVDSYIYGANNVGGILGYSSGGVNITNCYNTSIIVSESYSEVSYCGGICGRSQGDYIYNCYNTGIVNGYGVYVGAIVGSFAENGHMLNCYYLKGSTLDGDRVQQNGIGTNDGSLSDEEGVTTSATKEQFANGYVAYMFNQLFEVGIVYYQTLGEDATPSLDSNHGMVYPTSPCHSFSNVRDDVKEHEFENGICTVCGAYEEATWSEAQNAYLIGNAGQLYWFAEFVNSGEGTDANAELIADIVVNENVLDEDGDLSDDFDANDIKEWIPIGLSYVDEDNQNPYCGSFNGNGHTVSGLVTYIEDEVGVGLFGSVKNGEIANVGVIDSYFAALVAGSICGELNGGVINNCYSTSLVYGYFAGGICGGGVNPSITNCYNIGKLKLNGECIGGILGVSFIDGPSGSANMHISNCYYLNHRNGPQVGIGNTQGDDQGVTEGVSSMAFEMGYVGYMLNQNDNNVWYQNIFEDYWPTFNNSKNLVTGYVAMPYSAPVLFAVGDVVLAVDMTLPEEMTLILSEETSLEITNNATLTVDGTILFAGGSIVYKGKVATFGEYVPAPEVEPSPELVVVPIDWEPSGVVECSSSFSNGKILVEAVASEGFRFVRWHDNNSTNPERTINLNKSGGEFYAEFEPITYQLTVVANGGTVEGADKKFYNYGAKITLTATADQGNQFVRWSDGSTENPYTYYVYEDVTLEAIFSGVNDVLYTVSAVANNSWYGYVSGGSVYSEGETATLTAEAEENCHFVQWTDGDKNNPRNVVVVSDSSFVAKFAVDTFNISVVAENGRVIMGEGQYAWNSYANIAVAANEGYHFSHWTDDDAESSARSYLVEGNATLTAVFEPNYYDIIANVEGNGRVDGAGSHAFGSKVTLTAVPATGYHFTGWSDGETNAKRTFTVSTNNAEYLASFEINTYNVTVNTEHGHVVLVVGNDTVGISSDPYNHGTELTFEAVPDEFYKFARWTTTNTASQYTVTLTSNLTLSPLFIPEDANIYTLTVTAGEGGSATGSGNYIANEKVKLTATPNQGYRFVKWNDGSTKNPYEYTVTKTASVIAQFAINSYDLEVLAGANGTVTGGGTFTYGTQAKVTATANAGYHFVSWSDGNTNAERTITVSENTTVTAEFAINTYAVKASAANGKVEGAGTYNHGAEATLTAVANDGYHFVKWADGVETATRKVTVTSDLEFKAEFAINSYAVTVSATNGTVEGAGTYTYGENATISATAAEGFRFVKWSDGETRASRTVVVTDNLSFTAEFEINSYTVRASGSNGTVEGAGTYNHGAEATLTATANTGYHFSKWSDGVETATRKVTVTSDLSFTAEFAANIYTISVDTSANGTITGAGDYAYGETATLKATANKGYSFVMWTDSVKNATRSVEVTGNASFSAVFAINSYELTVKAKNGTVEGAGTYEHGAEATLTAEANAGYIFSKWDDGNTDNPRKVTVTGNKTYTATFKKASYAVTVNAKNGNITASSGTLQLGATITLTAVADSGYHFVMWSDSVLDNPRTVTLTAELLQQVTANGFEFTAIFEKDDNTAVADEAAEAVNIFAYGNTIVVENADSDIFVYTAMGRLIERVAAEAGRTEIQVNGSGIYVVKTGNTAKRVMIND